MMVAYMHQATNKHCTVPMPDGLTCSRSAVTIIDSQPVCDEHLDRASRYAAEAAAAAILASGDLNGGAS